MVRRKARAFGGHRFEVFGDGGRDQDEEEPREGGWSEREGEEQMEHGVDCCSAGVVSGSRDRLVVGWSQDRFS